MTSLEIDNLSRNRIVSEINENFFVEAGAGSGKTTMLVSRMAAMVEAGLDISKICAITFTKAAAGEFYDRFQRLLIERSNPSFDGDDLNRPGKMPKPTNLTRERCRIALQNIDLCFMGTIDAFCKMILSEHPFEAGIPSDASIVSDTEAETIYKQQYVKICQGEYGEELQSLAKTFQVLHRDAQEVFMKGISFVMNNRNVHFNYNETTSIDIDKDFAMERIELIHALKCMLDHSELKYDKEAKNLAAWERLRDIYKTICRRWSTNYTSLLYAIKTLKNIRLIPEALNHYSLQLGSVFEPGGKQGKWLECTAGQEGGLFEKLKKLQYDSSMSFLIKSIPIMEKALRERSSLTFFDYLYYLRNMLKRDAEEDGRLIRYIYDRHSYFLIDEFQDTNPMQAEVFFYLSSEYPVPQWSSCVPRPGSLFIVGDPKQSIYRFRSADVTSFLKVKNLFKENGGAILNLSRNFRSTRMLCEYYNRVFPMLLPDETKIQSKFEDIPLPQPAEGEFQGVYTYKAYTGQAETEYPDMTDPVRIADIIERLVRNRHFLIRGEKENELRPIKYSDIMVISYGKKKLGPILRELDIRNIPVRVEGDVPFAGNKALYDLSLLYTAVSDTNDSISLYGALTGNLIALTKEDILQFKACGGVIDLKSTLNKEVCNHEAAIRVASQIERLKDLHTMALRLSPAALYTKIMDEFRLYQMVPAENLEVVYYVLELIRNAERSGLVVSLNDGAAYIKELIAGESGEERCLSLTANKDCVHLANLHKVKGLEAPIVILAAAGNSTISGSYRMIHGDSGSEGYIFSLESERDENGRSRSYFSTSDYSEEKAAETDALRAEGQRLVYVAATRARNVLILCNSVRIIRGRESTNSRWSPVMKSGLQDIFEVIGDSREYIDDNVDEIDAAVLYDDAERESVLNNRVAENPTFRIENPSRLYVLSKLSESLERSEETYTSELVSDKETECQNTEAGRPYGALLGTMIHKLMEMLVTTRNTVNIDMAIGEIIREYCTTAMEGYEEKLREDLLNTADRIQNGGYVQTNDLPQDILGTLLAADEVYCEIPFCYKDEAEEKTIWNGIMDVVYSSAGQWHIVDYKTNADGNNLDTKYQAQLSAYVKAFKGVTGFDADAFTYHIDI